MNYGPLLFLGILFTLASSFLGLVVTPNRQLGSLEPHLNPDTATRYPAARPGEAQQGAEVYRSLGCIYCHTQQVRPGNSGSDIERGWGKRRTVSRDYIFDRPVQLGTSRTGPDLTNVGARKSDPGWHYAHLFNPQSTSPGSVMPPYPFLFDVRPVAASGPSTNAVVLPGPYAAPAGYEVLPRLAARQLVAYLQSLKSGADLPEAPVKTEDKAPADAGSSATNAPAAK